MSEQKEKFYNRILIILSVLIFLCVFLGSCLSVNAASKDNFPFYSSYIDNSLQSYFVNNSSAIETIMEKYPTVSDNYSLFVYEASSNSTYYYIHVYCLTDTSNFACYDSSNTVIDWADFSDYESDYFRKIGSSSCTVWKLKKSDLSFSSGSSTNASHTDLSFFGNHSINSIGITYCYPIYVKGEVLFQGVPILKEGEPLSVVIPTGHATESDFDSNDNINTGGHAQQPNSPSFPTFIPPTIDTSTLETLVESLIDFVSEFAYFVGECFSTFFSWVVSVIQNGLQSIINTLHDLADFLYNNFVSLFEAFFSAFGNFFSIILDLYNHGLDENGNFSSVALGTYLFVPEVESILDIMEENDEYGFIDVINFLATTITGLGQYIHNATPTHYINIPSFQIMGVTIPATIIDFSWYNNYKVVGDAIISAFLIIGYIYWLWTRLPGWFRGNSGDIFTENTSNSSDYHGTKIGF